MLRIQTFSVVLLLLATAPAPAGQPAPPLVRVGIDNGSGTSGAVIVGRTALVHTAQLLPTDASGELVGRNNPDAQLQQLMKNLAVGLSAFGADYDNLVKVNVYLARAELATDARRTFSKSFEPDQTPAVSFVQTALPSPGALVALDAVAALDRRDNPPQVLRRKSAALAGRARHAHLAVLPPGGVVYISGQAERATDLAAATSKTMGSLHRTLSHLGLGPEHVVQLKGFMEPMSEAAVVHKEMERFYPNGLTPPISLVEWSSSLPIEIEMIAMVPAGAGSLTRGQPVTFVTPPGMTGSPVFSRVACADASKTVYVSGLYSKRDGDGESQVRDLFTQLGTILRETGSDFRHLVKATYYVSDADASTKLNALRPDFYDPQRPPAASKAMVRGVGQPSRSITLDMIAVVPE